MLKRLLALLMTLCMVMSIAPAMATSTDATEEAEGGVAVNPYTLPDIEVTIALPGDLQVTNEEVSDEGVVVKLAKDGRADTGYVLSLAYNDAYEDYVTGTLPDEMKQELIDYYASRYKNDSPPYFTQADEADYEGLTDEEKEYAIYMNQCFLPFVATGTGSDGNFYIIYICIIEGYVLTVSCGIAAADFDEDALATLYNLYWQATEMFGGEEGEEE